MVLEGSYGMGWEVSCPLIGVNLIHVANCIVGGTQNVLQLTLSERINLRACTHASHTGLEEPLQRDLHYNRAP